MNECEVVIGPKSRPRCAGLGEHLEETETKSGFSKGQATIENNFKEVSNKSRLSHRQTLSSFIIYPDLKRMEFMIRVVKFTTYSDEEGKSSLNCIMVILVSFFCLLLQLPK